MTTPTEWMKIILDAPSAGEAWAATFGKLKEVAVASRSPVELHNQTVAPDRLLSEGGWELWIQYTSEAPKTSAVLQEWCSGSSSGGRASGRRTTWAWMTGPTGIAPERLP